MPGAVTLSTFSSPTSETTLQRSATCWPTCVSLPTSRPSAAYSDLACIFVYLSQNLHRLEKVRVSAIFSCDPRLPC